MIIVYELQMKIIVVMLTMKWKPWLWTHIVHVCVRSLQLNRIFCAYYIDSWSNRFTCICLKPYWTFFIKTVLLSVFSLFIFCFALFFFKYKLDIVLSSIFMRFTRQSICALHRYFSRTYRSQWTNEIVSICFAVCLSSYFNEFHITNYEKRKDDAK